MSFVYANSGSGPSAGGIGWFDFGSLNLKPGDSYTGLGGTLSDGTTITFDLSAPLSSAMVFNAIPSPTYGVFGYVNYTGISGNVLLQNDRIGDLNPGTIVLSNIVAKDINGNVINSFTTLVSDAENTNIGESWKFITDGDPWKLFYTIGNNPTTLNGVGTNTVDIIGTTQLFTADYVLSTDGPKTLTLSTISNGGLEAVAIGFVTTSITLQKVIGNRINSNDQFNLSISGIPTNSVSTTGNTNGIQVERATIYALPLNTYTLNESMSVGSVSLLSDYIVKNSGINATPGGTTPSTGNFPINVTPALGDEIVYTVINAEKETFTKAVDKSFANKGDILTYTVTINNPNDFVINNVLMSDPIPAGTTYMGNLIVSSPYSGTNPQSGITINSIAPMGNATVSWQVQVNSDTQTASVSNVASVSVPGGNSGNTNIVTTKINNADLTSTGNFIKSVDKLNAVAGDELTYTLALRNTGNVSANNVVVKDIIPAGTTYVPFSTTSSLPFTGDASSFITLSSPIIPGGNETISFKVKINNTIPLINPIPNNASVNYTFTVDPAKPNEVANKGYSNTVYTNVVYPKADVSKTTDKSVSYIGEVITYNINVVNNGNTPLENVVVNDLIQNGVIYIPGSLVVSVPYSNDITSGVILSNPILTGDNVTISFKVKVTSIPNPNPINNKAVVKYDYVLNPNSPNMESGTESSNIVLTMIFRNNYINEINDIILSVSMQQSALAAIINEEGAKIQVALNIQNISSNELMCINKSVKEMISSINRLEDILKEKLNILDCQINGCEYCK
ncbi:MAG: hypothetical protein RSB41_02660 [Bacilli bacterium]